MLNLVTLQEIVRDVDLDTPTGEVIKIKDVRFTYMTEAEFDELVADKGVECLHDLVLGWGEFLDAAGEQVEFSTENLTQLITFRWAKDALLTRYARALIGADSKNFSASLALGQVARNRAATKPNPKKKTRKASSKSSASRKKRAKKS